MQKLTLAKVRKAGRKAYEAKTLTAQSDDPQCVYENKQGCRCVVGAAMTKKTIKAIKGRGSLALTKVVSKLVNDNIISFPSREEQIAVAGLQTHHDNWCRAVDSLDDRLVEFHEGVFVKELYRED